MRRIVGAAAVFGLLAAGAVLAQDGPVTIKLKKAGAGDVVKGTKTEASTQKVTVTVMGQAQPAKEDKSVATFAYTDAVDERPAGAAKPTKMRRTYETAEVTAGGAKEDLGLKGKTVLIEKKGDAYEFSVDGKPLTGKAAQFLGKEFSGKKQATDEDFLPGKPVNVGETWKIDVGRVIEELADSGMVVDDKKSTATGKLAKVYTKGSQRYGVIEVTMDLVVTKLKGQQEVPLKEGSKLSVGLTMDGCIDGTEATGSGKMTMKGNLAGEIMGVQLAVDVDVAVNGNSVELKK
jgi:hypothetical protein